MKESTLVRKIILAVRAKYPRAWCRKLADRYTRGLPDLLIVFQRNYDHGDGWSSSDQVGVLWVETKSKDGRVSPIQQAEHEKIRQINAEGLEVIVATTVKQVLEQLARMGAYHD